MYANSLGLQSTLLHIETRTRCRISLIVLRDSYYSFYSTKTVVLMNEFC